MEEYITKVQIKNREERYNIKDSDAVKVIKCINAVGEKEECNPDSDGVVEIKIPTIQKATSKILGGVLVSEQIDKTNIELDKNGYIYANVPIKSILSPDGVFYKNLEELENTIKIPSASFTTYGMVKTSNSNHNIYIDTNGYIYTKFGTGNNVFENILIEESYIDFEKEYFEKSFEVQEEQ